MKKRYGLNLQKEFFDKLDTDWELGGISDLKPCVAEIPEPVRNLYLPKGELQNIGEEKMDCASRSVTNILEAKLTYLYRNNLLPKEHNDFLMSNGYVNLFNNAVELSDAYTAILSGTTRSGNSLKAPCDSVHRDGFIPKSLLPQGSTWDEHHDPQRITPAMKRLGKKAAELFTVNYERVFQKDYVEVLKRDMLDVGAFAWPDPENGEYPRIQAPFNHAFILFQTPPYYAFDNYYDVVDNDFIKKLRPDYLFMDYAYRIYISTLAAPRFSLWGMIRYWFSEIFK
jgi:hypothetical protein